MLKQIWVIGRNTYKETIRDRILYILLGFSILVISASVLAGSVSLGQELRVIQNFSLTAIVFFLLIITVFIGTQLVYREVERKTVYMVLSKPISRDVFYLGKFVGISLTLSTATLIMGLVYFGLVSAYGGQITAISIIAILMTLMEALLLTAVGMLFSTFTSPFASAIYTVALALIGHSSQTIKLIAERSGSWIEYLLTAVYYIFPNLEKFNFRNDVVFNTTIQIESIWPIVVYAIAYTVGILLLGIVVIRKHEF